jgi:hypothetical protein
MPPKEASTDREVIRQALDHIVNDDLPTVVHLTKSQREHLMGLIEFAAMVASIKRFGVPAFTLAATLGGAWMALNQFFGFKR